MSHGHILLVDDDEEILALCKRILETKGYAATTAKDACEALRFLEEHEFDVMCTDQCMPGMQGTELARHAMKCYPGMRVCIMSSTLSEEDCCREAPGAAHIEKPLTGARLLGEVARAFE